jgi:hypothetical protein
MAWYLVKPKENFTFTFTLNMKTLKQSLKHVDVHLSTLAVCFVTDVSISDPFETNLER